MHQGIIVIVDSNEEISDGMWAWSVKTLIDDKIWRYFHLWILAPGIEPGASGPALIY